MHVAALAEPTPSTRFQPRSLQGQLWRGPAKSHTVTVELEGPSFTQSGVADLIKVALLKGLLPAVPTIELEGADVNMVNAQLLAAEAGVKVTLNRAAGGVSGSYANLVRVVVDGPTGQRVAAGTVIEGQPRIVQLDHWQSFPTFAPEGHVLLFNNFDR